MVRITPNLWFDTEGQEAAEFYCSVFPNSAIKNMTHYGDAGPRPAGTVLTVDFVLDGQEFTAINGGPGSRSTRPSPSSSIARTRKKSTTTGTS